MSEMIERVARKLTDRVGVDPDDVRGGTWDGGSYPAGEPAWTSWADDARAAIEAMREPTKSMVEASYFSDDFCHHDVWQAMIDAALGDQGEQNEERERSDP